MNTADALLTYSPTTGQLLWTADGTEAGWIEGNGYRRVEIDGRKYAAHRLAWLLHYDETPPETIDHINGDKADNRIQNLRAATHSRNCMNRRPWAVGAHGRGVYWRKNRKKFEVTVGVGRRRIFVGRFDALMEAEIAYCEAAIRLHGEFVHSSVVDRLQELKRPTCRTGQQFDTPAASASGAARTNPESQAGLAG